MGRASLQDFIEVANDLHGDLALDRTLIWHLTSNHYPPLPLSLIPCCKQAIELWQNGEQDTQIDLPDGISWRGQSSCPIQAAMDGWHLWEFLREEEDDY